MKKIKRESAPGSISLMSAVSNNAAIQIQEEEDRRLLDLMDRMSCDIDPSSGICTKCGLPKSRKRVMCPTFEIGEIMDS